MSLQIGIVGLPNVGKSTLFQAITKKAVDCANFPFCTIDPNVGVVEVPDERLWKLSKVSESAKTIPTVVEFVDIAGLVRGASEGQGLGNKFLAHIRECDAIAQVLRAFADPNVIHVDHTVDPMRDVETIGIELALADLETVTKRLDAVQKQSKSGKTPEMDAQLAAFPKAKALLEQGKPLREAEWTEDEYKQLKQLSLMTLKPMLYVVNVDEGQMADGSWKSVVGDLATKPGIRLVPVCVKMEAELAGLPDADRNEYLQSVGLERSGLDQLILEAYAVLGLITYFTSGPQETRAWTVTQGASAPQAAGVIHTDFEKNFIRAEITNWKDFVELGGEAKCREKGLVRIEGKEYIIRDGDTCYFRIGG